MGQRFIFGDQTNTNMITLPSDRANTGVNSNIKLEAPIFRLNPAQKMNSKDVA